MKARSLPAIFTPLLVIALGLTPAWSDTVHLSESQLDDMIQSEGRLFELVGRLGDGAEGGIPQLDLVGGLGHSQGVGVFEWRSNQEVAFSLSYAYAWLEFRLADTVLGFDPGSGPAELYIRCHAETQGTGVTLLDLHLDGERLGDSCWIVGPDAGDVLWIDVAGLSQGFDLEGTVNLAWIGDAPGAESLSFAIGGTSGGAGNLRSWSQVKQLY